jgi:hypothetical protein
MSEGFGLLPRYDAVERCSGWSDARPVDAHGIKHLDVHDVEAVNPIHQHLVEVLLVDDRIDDEWIPTRMWNAIRVVGAVEGDGGP